MLLHTNTERSGQSAAPAAPSDLSYWLAWTVAACRGSRRGDDVGGGRDRLCSVRRTLVAQALLGFRRNASRSRGHVGLRQAKDEGCL